MSVRKIIHIDMDAFFASVEQRDNPSLKGRPVAVGYAGPRGVVATASYEARKYGVHSAMAASRAKRLCPQLIFVSARMDVYKAVSRRIHAIFHEYTDKVEPLSIDEAFLDVSHLPCATQAAKEIKARIFQETGLTASAGVSVNKLLAKIASDLRKPDGLFVVPPKHVQAFVARLPVEKFFGVGKVTAAKMHAMGIRTGADLRRVDLPMLLRRFGKTGRHYYDYARGKDEREVQPFRQRKSVGAEETFARDTAERRELDLHLEDVCRRVWTRSCRVGFAGRTVTVKLKFSDFRQMTRAKSFSAVLSSQLQLCAAAREILAGVSLRGRQIRLLGVTLSNTSKETARGQLFFNFGAEADHPARD